jgi:phosphoribosylaminoimidazole carboxylase PurE protein
MDNPLVGIVLGSYSDFDIIKDLFDILDRFGIKYEVVISSAHRSLNKTINYADSLEKRGIEVVISVAGYAAHLPGIIASKTTIPVIGVPVDSSPLKGIDSLLSIAQMPSGIPVATMSIGKAGAKNAGIFAAQILSIKYPEIRVKIKHFRKEMEIDIEKNGREVEERLLK